MIWSRILPTSCVAQRQSNSCDLLSYNHTTRMWNVTFCVFYLLSSYSSKTFRNSEMSHFRLYQIHISLFILIAACIICMSSFLLICWRFFPMFGVWLSVPRLFIVFSSVSTLKCTSCHLLWVSNILWIAANLTPLYLRLFYYPCLNTRTRNVLPVDIKWNHAFAIKMANNSWQTEIINHLINEIC